MHTIKILPLILAFGLAAPLAGCDDKKDAKADDKVAKADGKKDEKDEKAADDGEKADDSKEAGEDEGGGDEGGDGDNPLVGTWELDPESFKEMEDYKKAPDDQKKMMEAMLGSMKMEITFTADSMKLEMAMGDKKEAKEGKYTIKSNEGGKLVVESEVDGKKEEISLTVNGETMTMEKDKDKMAFKKKS